jgi:superfamily II DNA/RNA helicase
LFLLPNDRLNGCPPPFLVFFNSIIEAEEAVIKLREQLPHENREKIFWYHSNMSMAFRARMCDMMRDRQVWGAFVTDAFGMVCSAICLVMNCVLIL